MLVNQFIYWLQVWVPHTIYGSTILSMLIEALLSLRRCHWSSAEGEEAVAPFETLGSHHWCLSPDDKCQFGFHTYMEVASFCYHPSHSNLSLVHLPVFFVMVLSFFMDKLPSCLAKHLLGKLLSRALDLQRCEIPSLFLKGIWHTRNLLFLFCAQHGSSQK